MNSKKFNDISDLETRADRLMRILQGSGERPSFKELSVLRKIARMSEEEDFGRDDAYARLISEIGVREEKKRRQRLFFSYAASIAALLVVGFFVGKGFWQKSGLDYSGDLLARQQLHKWTPSDEHNVRLTLNTGLVIDVSKDRLENQSTDDIRTIEKSIEAESVTAYNTLVVPRGRDYKITLDDGTVLTINSDTQVRFPTAFDSSERRIVVDYGEVFLRVAREEKRPFIVEAGGGEVKVLGTSFNVNAYPELPVTTTLISGKVSITRGTERAVLQPGNMAVFSGGAGVEVRKADTSQVLAWMTGEFIFEDLPLSNIVTQLERWYDVEMTLEEMSLGGIRFTGVINKKYSLIEVLDIISKTSDVEFDTSNASVIKVRKKIGNL